MPGPDTYIDGHRLGERLQRFGLGDWFTLADRPDRICRLMPAQLGPSTSVQQAMDAVAAAQAVVHPRVLSLHAVQLIPGHPARLAIVTETYDDLRSVERVMLPRAPLREMEALHILRELVEAVAAMARFPHAHGWLTPARLFLDQDGHIQLTNPWVGWIEECLAQARTTGTTDWEFTWVAPECIIDPGSADLISDLFICCAIGYTLVTGVSPFESDTVLELGTELLPTATDPRERNPALSHRLAMILMTGLDLGRAGRYQDAASLIADIDAALERQDPPNARGLAPAAGDAAPAAGPGGNEPVTPDRQAPTAAPSPGAKRGPSDRQAARRRGTDPVAPQRQARGERSRGVKRSPLPFILGGTAALIVIAILAAVALSTKDPVIANRPLPDQASQRTVPNGPTVQPPGPSTHQPFGLDDPETSGPITTTPTPRPDPAATPNPTPADVPAGQATRPITDLPEGGSEPASDQAPATIVTSRPAASTDDAEEFFPDAAPGLEVVLAGARAVDSAVAPEGADPAPAPPQAHPPDHSELLAGLPAARDVRRTIIAAKPREAEDLIADLDPAWRAIYAATFNARAQVQSTLIDHPRLARLQPQVELRPGQAAQVTAADAGGLTIRLAGSDGSGRIGWTLLSLQQVVELHRAVEGRATADQAALLCRALIGPVPDGLTQHAEAMTLLHAAQPTAAPAAIDAGAADDGEPRLRDRIPNQTDEILLLARDGVVQPGSDGSLLWEFVPGSDGAVGERVWRSTDRSLSLKDGVSHELPDSESHLRFRFYARAGTTYRFRFRGRSTDLTSKRGIHDAIAVVFTPDTSMSDAAATHKLSQAGRPASLIDGWASTEDWCWIESTMRNQNGTLHMSGRTDVHFKQTGWQEIRIHNVQGPVELSAIWITTSLDDLPGQDVIPTIPP